MIIDCHTHFGNFGKYCYHLDDVINGMKKYNIDFSLISCLDGAEYEHPSMKNSLLSNLKQIDILKATVDAVKQYPDRLRGLLWLKPATDKYDPQLEQELKANLQWIVGLKIHPYHSSIQFNDRTYIPYIEMAQRLNLPIVVYTAADLYSLPIYVFERAREYPDVDFVMTHMGLHTDHREAMELIKRLPNLYGDTTLVETSIIINAINIIGSDKMMFGSHAPLGGIDTYQRYENLLRIIRTKLSPHDSDNLLWKNAKWIFGLKFDNKSDM